DPYGAGEQPEHDRFHDPVRLQKQGNQRNVSGWERQGGLRHVGRIHEQCPLNVSQILREPNASGAVAAGSAAARKARREAPAREPGCGAWGARPKPRPASPANVSKRGLSARPYATNQTLIMVNVRLPKGILAARKVGRKPENRR